MHNRQGLTFIVDPGSDSEKIQQALLRIENINLKYIFLTHGHYDHVQAVDEIKKCYPKADVVIGEGDIEFIRKLTEQGMYVGKFLKNVKSEVVATQDGDFWPFDDFEVKAISCPGHTLGGFSFLVDSNLFSGDTLFWHTVGRTDFPRSSQKELKETLSKLILLPENTIIYPGHGKKTTIAEEKNHNVFF